MTPREPDGPGPPAGGLLDSLAAGAARPGGEPPTADEFAEAVCAELRARVRAGEPLRVEDCLERFPRLADDPERLLDLVYCEFLARRERGEAPSADEYARRFPDLAADVHVQLQVDEALGSLGRAGPAAPQGAATPHAAGPTIACPHCGDRIERPPASSPQADVVCPGCGSRLGMVGPASTIGYGRDGEPAFIGRFELIRQVGMGSFGTVYKALDTKLERIVALKVSRLGNAPGSEGAARFLREACSVAQLRHSGVVPVHEVGVEGGPRTWCATSSTAPRWRTV